MTGVALVLVSHSQRLAAGVAELAAQMAPDVALYEAGGLDGELGTSFEAISAAVSSAAENGRSVAILTDLGSAELTAEAVLEGLDESEAARVRLVDAPFVEGAVAAAVAAQLGGDLDDVAQAASAAWRAGSAEPASAAVPRADVESSAGVAHVTPAASTQRTVLIRNRLGLHARPAAQVAAAASELAVAVFIDGVLATSVLSLMKLGVVAGDTVTVSADGPGAEEAVAEIAGLIESGFGED